MQPILDAVLGYAGLATISYVWGNVTVYDGVGSYPTILFAVILPVYLLIWLLMSYFTGGYDKPYKIYPVVGGVLFGSLVVLVIYALMPENLRFSRALILFGMMWLILEMSLTRAIGFFLNCLITVMERMQKRFLVIGSVEETERVERLLKSTSIKPDFIGLVTPDNNSEVPDNYLGNIRQVPDIIIIYKITEIIFVPKIYLMV